MQENMEVQKVKRYKDGETRDRNGRWAGKVVTVRKEYYALIEEWQKQTGMKKAQFWRNAVMLGALAIAKEHGIDALFPVLEELPQVNIRPKRPFPAWLFRKSTSNYGLYSVLYKPPIWSLIQRAV